MHPNPLLPVDDHGGAHADRRVLSVNVGRPREVPWRGTMVSTAFFKSPVAGQIPVKGFALEGDGQADLEVHGGRSKCLFVYPSEHFPAWEEWLGCQDLAPGAFGENLTVAGLTEKTAVLGDRFRIGSGEFVVSEPRQPCYKVDVRTGRPGAAAEMIRSGRVGFYLGLLRRGSVCAGDAIEFLGGPQKDRVSIELLHRLSSNAGVEDIDLLEQVANCAHVLPDWAGMLRTKAAALRRRLRRPRRPAPAWDGFRDFTVTQRIAETDDVVSLLLAPADGSPLPAYDGGQFVTVRLPSAGDGGARGAGAGGVDAAREGDGVDDGIVRSYSLCGPADARAWRITVRRARDSQGGSRRLCASRVGDRLEVRAPAGEFTLRGCPAASPVVLVSGGIGITPVLSIARDWAVRPGGTLTAVHAVHTACDAALVRELAEVLAPHPRASLHVFVSDGTLPRTECAVTAHAGRMTQREMARLLPHDIGGAHAYVCGPPGLVGAAKDMLPRLGLGEDAIHTEVFAAPAAAGDGRPAVPPGGYEVTFAQHSETVLWSDADATLLDLADEAGVDIPSSCRQGTCGTCVTTVQQGAVAYVRGTSLPVPDGACLPCIAVPASRLSLDA